MFEFVIQREHIEPVHDVGHMEITSFQEFDEHLLCSINFLNDYGVLSDISDKFFQNRIPHVKLVKIQVLQLYQKHVYFITHSVLLLSLRHVKLIPRSSETLHRILVQKLQQNSLPILLYVLLILQQVLIQF